MFWNRCYPGQNLGGNPKFYSCHQNGGGRREDLPKGDNCQRGDLPNFGEILFYFLLSIQERKWKEDLPNVKQIIGSSSKQGCLLIRSPPPDHTHINTYAPPQLSVHVYVPLTGQILASTMECPIRSMVTIRSATFYCTPNLVFFNSVMKEELTPFFFSQHDRLLELWTWWKVS